MKLVTNLIFFIRLVLPVLLLSTQSCLWSYINSIIKWEKNGQIIIGCGDVHDCKEYRANYAQKYLLEQKLPTLDLHNTCLFVEDIKAYDGKDPVVKEYIETWPSLIPHNNLTAYAHRFGLEAISLEYRYARSAAIDPFLTNGTDTGVKATSVIEELDKVVSTIHSFDDGQALNNFYNEHTQFIYDFNKPVLDAIRTFNGTVPNYIHTSFSQEKQRGFALRLARWDLRLLDLLAIHQIVRHAHVSKILIFAGAMHIFNIGKTLESQLNFKRTQEIGSFQEMPYLPISLVPSPNKISLPQNFNPTLTTATPLNVKDLDILFQ